MNADIATVTDLYGAFARGDLPGVLDLMDDEISFDAEAPVSAAAAAGHPLLRARRGKADLLEFFAEFARCEVHAFELVDVLASATQVAVQVHVAYTTPAGVRVEDDEIHRWTFAADGRAASVKHYCDTAQHLSAWFPQRAHGAEGLAS